MKLPSHNSRVLAMIVLVLSILCLFLGSLNYVRETYQANEARKSLGEAAHRVFESYTRVAAMQVGLATCEELLACKQELTQYISNDFPGEMADVRLLALSSELGVFATVDSQIQSILENSTSLSVSSVPENWQSLLDQLQLTHNHLTNVILEAEQFSDARAISTLWVLIILLLTAVVSGALLAFNLRNGIAAIVDHDEKRREELTIISEAIDTQGSTSGLLSSQFAGQQTKQLLAKVRKLEANGKESKRTVELFRNINKAINYEFRSLANTLSGGLRVISGEVSGKYMVLSNEMLQATSVLDELAKNFHGVFSTESLDDSCTFDEVMNRVVSLVAAKCQRSKQSFESYVSPSLPKKLPISGVKLIWSIYLEVARAVDLYRNKSLVMTATSIRKSDGSQSIEFGYFFVSNLEDTLSSLRDRDWGMETEVAYGYSEAIFADEIESDLAYSYCPDGDVRYRYKMKLPQAFSSEREEQLTDKKLVVIGRENLTRDIIREQLRNSGATVNVYDEVTVELKSNLGVAQCDGVLVIAEGNDSEAKETLHDLSSLTANHQVKLILSVATSEMSLADSELADLIIQRPTSPEIFLSQVVNLLQLEKTVSDDKKLNIVCIDDDPTHGFLLTQLLEMGGWSARHFDNAIDAIDYITTEVVDVVFMDCVMPQLDGFEATRRLRAYQRSLLNGSPMVIIGATGLSSVAEMNQCIEAGMDYVINKPYSEEDIYKVLESYTTARKLRGGFGLRSRTSRNL